jgi:rare lipoprotein A
MRVLMIVFVVAVSSFFSSIQNVQAQTGEKLTGKASYYADRYHGRTTANGEKLDNNALTAAHPSLPFGTMVRVTNPKNGKSVDVRITDRGPYSKSRLIDLTKAAAKAIGMIRAGVARVEVEILEAR